MDPHEQQRVDVRIITGGGFVVLRNTVSVSRDERLRTQLRSTPHIVYDLWLYNRRQATYVQEGEGHDQRH